MAFVRDLVDRLRHGKPRPEFDLVACDHCGTLVINPDGETCPKCGVGELST